MSKKKKLDVFTNRKARDKDTPWIRVRSQMFGGETITSVLKNNQADTLSSGASAFCVVVSPATGPLGDMGDTYWAQVYAGELIEVDGVEPTLDELEDWMELQHACAPDPMAAYGF
jgi:hypothetical protein